MYFYLCDNLRDHTSFTIITCALQGGYNNIMLNALSINTINRMRQQHQLPGFRESEKGQFKYPVHYL